MNKLAGSATLCAAIALLGAGCKKADPVSGYQYGSFAQMPYPALSGPPQPIFVRQRYTFDQGQCTVEFQYGKGIAAGIDMEKRRRFYVIADAKGWPNGEKEGDTIEAEGKQAVVVVLGQKWYTVLKGTYTVDEKGIFVDWSTFDMTSLFAQHLGFNKSPEQFKKEREWMWLRQVNNPAFPPLARVVAQ